MTTVTTVDDFVRALREQPELLETVRQLILTEELLELPQKFAALAQYVQELAAVLADTTRRLDDFIETTNRNFQLVNERLERLEADVGTLKSDVDTLKSDVDTLKSDMKVVKDDVANLKGSDMERRAQDNILNIAKDELGLTRGRVLMSCVREVDPQLLADAERAEAQGLVTEEEVDNLLVTDIIIRARRISDKQYVYATIEVSRTIHDHDINRAYHRARTLAAITGAEVIAVAMGGIIQPHQQALADAQGVLVVLPAIFTGQGF